MAASIPDPSNAILPVLFVIAGFLTSRCVTKPDPPTAKRASSDDLMTAKQLLKLMKIMPVATLLNAVVHAYIAYIYPGRLPSAVCPNPSNLNASLFQWNAFTVTALASMIVGGITRVLAIAQLGNSFTWELAKPTSGLKTTGLHGWMQHPSYTGMFMNFPVFTALIGRSDGVMGCFLPSFLASNTLVIYLPTIVSLAIIAWGVPRRIRDEEDMLRREFGKEYNEYNRKTKRFIPGVY